MTDIADIPEHFYDPIHIDLGTIPEEMEEELLADTVESIEEVTTKAADGDGLEKVMAEKSDEDIKPAGKTKGKKPARVNVATKGNYK